VESEFPDLLRVLATYALVAILVLPLALVSGRAKAERLRELQDDLKNGRLRGYAVVAIVVGVVVVASLEHLLR